MTAVFLDKLGNRTKQIMFRAYLAPTDEIPIVLGFKDLLEKFQVCFNFSEKKSYLESK
ncbi:MAG: hypothetical protein QW815_09285 [Nitrososphaerota archaeon]